MIHKTNQTSALLTLTLEIQSDALPSRSGTQQKCPVDGASADLEQQRLVL